MNRKSFKKAVSIFNTNNGILRTSQAKKLGIHQPVLNKMIGDGLLVKEERGLYRLASYPPLSNPDLVKVSLKAPQAIICLISALHFHQLTTQIPYKVYIALPQNVKKPRLEYPPLDVVWITEKVYSSGIEKHNLDGIEVKIYSPEKTIADCFKFRNKVGKSIAIEALKDYLRLPGRKIDKLLHYAHIDRVENIMRPYIEAIFHPSGTWE
jgi:predicted transcriptional regulator of viral defense system